MDDITATRTSGRLRRLRRARQARPAGACPGTRSLLYRPPHLGPGRHRAAREGRRAPASRHLCTTAIEAAQPGDVIVIEQRTGIDAASWGGNLSLGAQLRGVSGVIIEGPGRDIDEARQYGFPVFARTHTARTARGRIVETGTNVPITVGEVTVSPGDYVVADGSAGLRARHRDRPRAGDRRGDRREGTGDGRRAARGDAHQRGDGQELRDDAEVVAAARRHGSDLHSAPPSGVAAFCALSRPPTFLLPMFLCTLSGADVRLLWDGGTPAATTHANMEAYVWRRVLQHPVHRSDPLTTGRCRPQAREADPGERAGASNAAS